SFGRKAINLLSWCFAPTKVKQVNDCPPVGHMSVFNDLCEGLCLRLTAPYWSCVGPLTRGTFSNRNFLSKTII
ncbi:MAG: hypothetical protein ACYS80_20320, partial [Planctomycetota bacterium]